MIACIISGVYSVPSPHLVPSGQHATYVARQLLMSFDIGPYRHWLTRTVIQLQGPCSLSLDGLDFLK